jgi:hypothetical protein
MEKYDKLRNEIKTGDVIIFNGDGYISGIIRWADGAYYSHTGIAYWVDDRLFIIDAWTNGVELVPMSRRMKIYKDFCLVRKNKFKKIEMEVAIGNSLNRVERDEVYGYWGLLRRLVKLKLKLDAKWINKKRRPVCSDIARDFLNDLGCICYLNVKLPSPQDIERYADPLEVSVLYEERISS